MTWELALDIILDALKDSGIVFLFVFVFEFIFSFIKIKMKEVLEKNRRIAPLFGALFGLIPQCGTSVLGADLYIGRHITIGTIVAIFLSCSDEAIPLLLSSGSKQALAILPLVGLKFVIGFIVGFLIDLIYPKQELHLEEKVDVEECHHAHIHAHHHEENEEEEEHKENGIHEHFVHPLLHSLELFGYVLAVNLFFGFLIGFIGEETFSNFISSNKYLAPLFSTVIGIIPNCASSVVISELFIDGHLSFGALLSGLLMNAGLGLMVLMKNKKSIKSAFIILGICFAVSLLFGYLTCLIIGF